MLPTADNFCLSRASLSYSRVANKNVCRLLYKLNERMEISVKTVAGISDMAVVGQGTTSGAIVSQAQYFEVVPSRQASSYCIVCLCSICMDKHTDESC